MARIIVYSDFLNASQKKHSLNSIEYNSEREGVELNQITSGEGLLDISYDNQPASTNQKKVIKEFIKLDPNLVRDFYYEDYKQKESMYQASKVISHFEQLTGENQLTNQIYLDYMATRPRVELNISQEDTRSNHGLFDNNGAADKNSIKQEIADHNSYVWRDIISLRRSDAIELGYDNQQAWKNILTSAMPKVAEKMKIPHHDFRWCAAFHNEGHHPHVHIMYYDIKGKNGFRDIECIESFKSTLANQIFDNEMYLHKELKNIFRTELEDTFSDKINSILTEKTSKVVNNLSLSMNNALIKLSNDLNEHGKNVYAYQSVEVKGQVDNIVEYFLTDKDLNPILIQFMKEKKALTEFYKLNTETFINDEITKIIHPQKGDRKVLHNLVLKAASEIRTVDLQENILNNKNFGSLITKIKDDSRSVVEDSHFQEQLISIIKCCNLLNMSPSDILTITTNFRNNTKDLTEEKVLETILIVRNDSFDLQDLKLLNRVYDEKILYPEEEFNKKRLFITSRLLFNMINFMSSETIQNQRELSRLKTVRQIDQIQMKHSK